MLNQYLCINCLYAHSHQHACCFIGQIPNLSAASDWLKARPAGGYWTARKPYWDRKCEWQSDPQASGRCSIPESSEPDPNLLIKGTKSAEVYLSDPSWKLAGHGEAQVMEEIQK